MYNNITVDFTKKVGKMKPMHAVNNGPIDGGVRAMGNDNYFIEAGIPYARLHDSAYYSIYGGEYSVDVHRIFRNFDADENDPNSYIFQPTDNYLASIDKVGTKIFYRLGASIEHYYKNGTYPPKDFLKWARICEHIILHYTEGWANGFHYDIEYWEIWNEPDCTNADGSHPCWQGTDEQFIEFFVTALGYLKKRFPKLKFGGPAFTGVWWTHEYTTKLLSAVKDAGVDLDFYSFHGYTNNPRAFAECAAAARKHLDDAGFKNAELNLNEWNYMRGWLGEVHKYSLKTMANHKGAAFIAASMTAAQQSELDMFMYYDARPCNYNGLFDDYFDPRKGYYSFKMFNELYKLRTEIATTTDDNALYALSASEGDKQSVMLTYFDDNDDALSREVCLSLKGITGLTAVKFYLLDKDKDMKLVKEELVSSNECKLYLKMNNFDVVFIEFTPHK